MKRDEIIHLYSTSFGGGYLNSSCLIWIEAKCGLSKKEMLEKGRSNRLFASQQLSSLHYQHRQDKLREDAQTKRATRKRIKINSNPGCLIEATSNTN